MAPENGGGGPRQAPDTNPIIETTGCHTSEVTTGDGSEPVRQVAVIAVLTTSINQLDALAGLGADALLHGNDLPLECMVRAVDTIAQRQRSALQVIDLREQEAVPT